MDYEIVRYSRALMPQLAELRSSVWGRSRADNLAYLNWKYEQNPYLDEPVLHVALAAGRAVGMRGIFGTRWQFGSSRSLVIPEAADFIIDRDHRGRWLDQRLVEFGRQELAEKGYPFLICTNAQPAMRHLRMIAGARRAAAYQNYCHGEFSPPVESRYEASDRRMNLLMRARHCVGRKLRRLKKIVTFQQFDKWAASAERPFVATTTAPLGQVSELAAQFRDSAPIQHLRDERFYRWKLRNPHSDYRFLFYQRGTSPAGFLLLQQNVLGGATSIVDWATSTTDIWVELLRAVVSCKIDRLNIAATRFSAAEQDVAAAKRIQSYCRGRHAQTSGFRYFH